MAGLRAYLTAAVGAIAFAANAQAADVPGSWVPPLLNGSSLPAVELMSGWYLRGDIGYRYNSIGSVDSAAPIFSQTYDDVPAGGVGFGFKRSWLRADLTFDYGALAKYHGTTATATLQPQYSARIEAMTALANVYIDLGTWSGFSPYVGGGVGGSYVRSADFVNTTLPVPGPVVSTAEKWNFSWAWMAGVAMQVTPNWTIDIGYRYLHLGDAISGTEPTNAVTTWKDLSAQEIRVGLRFLID
jgi:opacity protein-like surface antigen